MSYPYRITPLERESHPRCRIRPLANGFGFCHGARSCAECPRAKLDQRSPRQIEPDDMVRTAAGDVCAVERFDERRGFRTGYIWLQTKRGLQRYKVSAVMLHRKTEAYKAVA